jgi:hypothetical protein
MTPLRDACAALDRRLEAVEGQLADCLEIVQLEAERATRWADMNAQLRRFLGRLDAHAGQQRRRDEEEGDANGHRDPKQLAAILRSKYPNAGA